MAVVRYHRYIGELWDDLDLEELVGELSDFLLQSGFGDEEGEWDEDSLQALHDAILDALMRRGLLSDEDLQKLHGRRGRAASSSCRRSVERLVREGYLHDDRGPALPRSHRRAAAAWARPGRPSSSS